MCSEPEKGDRPPRPLMTVTTLADLQRKARQLTAYNKVGNCGSVSKPNLVSLIARRERTNCTIPGNGRSSRSAGGLPIRQECHDFQ
tara:strand:- start:197 stop:454 length:258 start_codon:yes stop_codon:yes gene_type:complete